MNINDKFPWATFTATVLTFVFAIVGGAVVIWGEPGALTFEDYIKAMSGFAIAQGVLGVGRGIVSHGRNTRN